MLVVPRVFRVPCGVLAGRAALCARGRRPAREPSAQRASLGALSRSPARPRHRPRAPQQVPPGPPVPFTPVGPSRLIVFGAYPDAQLWLPTSNSARNSSMNYSNIAFVSLELQRFWGISKNDRDKLRATFGWRWCRRRLSRVQPPGPPVPSGALHTGGAWGSCGFVCSCLQAMPAGRQTLLWGIRALCGAPDP